MSIFKMDDMFFLLEKLSQTKRQDDFVDVLTDIIENIEERKESQ